MKQESIFEEYTKKSKIFGALKARKFLNFRLPKISDFRGILDFHGFGYTPMVRILNFLILGKDFDYSMTDIAEGSHVGWTSFTRAWKDLEKRKVIIHTRNIGRAELYKLNTQDSTVQKLVKLHWEIIKTETDKMLGKKKMLATS